MDNLTANNRKKNMRRIRYKDTKMEVLVRSLLHKEGLRFNKNVNKIKGKPDIVFPKLKIAVFLDSCFWHKCPYHYIPPKSNTIYWIPKIKKNKRRSIEVNKHLKKEGWIVLRFWEHQIKKDVRGVIKEIEEIVNKKKTQK